MSFPRSLVMPSIGSVGRRRRVPTILQVEAVECGAACLAMVLAAFGRWEPIARVREACGVTRDGTKAGNIVKAAKRFGLKAKGFRREPAGLKSLPLPQILFWNFNHFVVLAGWDSKTVHLVDPAYGPRRVGWDEVDEAFTGVTLAFEPGDDFRRAGRAPAVLTSLASRLSGSRADFVYVVLLAVVLTFPALLVPGFSKVFVDNYLIQRFDDWLAPILIGMACTGLAVSAITALQKHILLKLQTKLAVASSSRFLWHTLRLPLAFFSQRYAGEVGSRLQLNDRVSSTLTGPVALALLSLVSMAIYALIMVQFDLLLTLLVVAAAGSTMAAMHWASVRLADASRRSLMYQGKLQAVAMQGLSMIETFKSSGAEGLFFERWTGAHARVVNADQILGRVRKLVDGLPGVAIGLITALVLVVGGIRVMEGTLSLGGLVAFQALATLFLAPVATLVQAGAQIQETAGALMRIDDVADASEDAEFQRETDTAPRKLAGHVRVENVSFGYSPIDPPILVDVDLDVAPGTRIAIVGGSGSGKSTLGRLLAGLLEPSTGAVRMDGIDIREIDRWSLRASVAVVEQAPMLIEGTIRDNLTVWDESIPEDRMIAAGKDAAIHADVSERTGGYFGKTGEGGRDLSGGQRQRIAIARALAREPSVLILDEATSALDAVTEAEVLDNIRRRGCTCVIISHRLSAIRDCDRIVVMEAGRIVQSGRHGELREVEGAYRRLAEA